MNQVDQRRILIVDDFETIRFLLRRSLTDLGYANIDEASDGQEAVALLKKNSGSYSLVITDWTMPNMTGIDLLNFCRKSNDFKDIPVVMLTVETEKSQIVQAIRAGASSYIVKPFDLPTLDSKLKQIFASIAGKETKAS